MRVRTLVLALVCVALLAGCGGGGFDDGGESGPPEVSVSFDPDPLQPGPVTWTVVVNNMSGDDLELRFPTSQRADVTLSRKGEEIYRWSRARMFTQELGRVEVPDGQNEAFVLEEPGLDVEPGEYQLKVELRAPKQPLSSTRTVTVEPRPR